MRFSAATLQNFSARLVMSFVSLLALAGFVAPAAYSQVVISQIFGGNSASGPYNQDFVELLNAGSTPASLAGYGVQYASSTGTSYSVAFLPSTTLVPGQYFLVALANSSGGTSLPTPDYTYTNINLSGTTGKVYLTSSTTSLTTSVGSSGCPVSTTIVDYVGYGAGATCYRGGGPAPVITSSQSEARINACTALISNSTDFAASTPTPHNTSSTPAPCTGSTALAASGMVTPSSVYQGATALLTVRVTPASNPTSTGLTVTADLSSFGASSTQPLYDDGTHGDVTAGDNLFSLQATVPSSGTPTGPLSIIATVTDQQLRGTHATIPVTVLVPAPTVTIREIQAAKPSPYATQIVTTEGIVTSVKTNGFYLEAQDADQTPTTPEGILVYTGSTPPSTVAIGAVLEVTGTVNTYPALSASKTPGTEIDSPSALTVLQNSATLPTPISITATQDSPSGSISQFAKYEGMRVSIGSFTTTSGTDASLSEASETNTSNGQFYGTVTGLPRPFREPGISAAEPALPAGTNLCPLGAPATTCIPQWDSNPELLLVDSRITGGPAIDLTSLTTLTNVVGVMDFSSGAPEIILDAATRPSVSGGLALPTVPVQAATEFTVATFNMERFYNDQADADNPGSTAVTLTTAAFQRRLSKASLAIRNVLNTPDILGVEEMENLPTLTSLAQKISADALAAGQPDPQYQPYLFLATDGTAINTGMLVKAIRVDTVRAEQFGLTTTFTNSTGSQAILNDRTPLVVHLGIKRANLPDYPVTAIVVHQRSLISIDDTTSTGATVRLKREAQAEFLANLIQGYQAAGEHVVTVGDFNAFQFSDGYVDTIGVTTGAPVPAAEVLTPPVAGLVNPVLTDLTNTLPAPLQQSYVESGSAQVLDHILVTEDLARLNTRFVYAHIDADFPLIFLNNAAVPFRVSDHDPAVAYFSIPAPVLSLSATSVAFGAQPVNTSATKTVTLSNTGNDTLALSSLSISGTGYTQTSTCGNALAAGGSCVVTITFAPSADGSASGTLSINTGAATPTTVALSGTAADFSLSANTPSATVTNGQTATLLFNVSGTGGFSGTVTFSCSGLVTGESCLLTPTSTPLSASATSVVLAAQVSTTARQIPSSARRTTSSGLAGRQPLSRGGLALLLAALASPFTLLAHRRSRQQLRRLGLLSPAALLVFLATLTLTLAGCNGLSYTSNSNGTPAGNQTITVTATSGSLTRTATVSLTVQ